MSQTTEKIALVEKLPDSRTAHLQPVIDYLKSHGNPPATGDEFYYNRDGYGIYGFAQPLDLAALREHFSFPTTILLTETAVEDTRNFVSIKHNSGPTSGPALTFNI